MSRVDEIIEDAKALAFDMGIPALAEAVSASQDTVRNMLRDPPKSIKILRRLDVLSRATKEGGRDADRGDR